MTALRVALATCAAFPGGDEDATVLVTAFERAGHTASWHAWDDRGVDWSAFDLVVLRSTWDYVDRLGDFLAWAVEVPALVNPAPVVGWSADKVYLRDLADRGVPTVPTTFVRPGEPFPELADGEYVVKPSVGAGSRGAGRFVVPAAGVDARAHAAALHDDNRTVLVQPYLAAVDTEGETAVLCFGGVVSHAARKSALLHPGTVRPMRTDVDPGAHGLFVEETMAAAEPTDAQRAVAEQVLALLGERFGAVPPYARIDLLPTAEGPVVVECEVVEPSLFLRYAPGPDAAADRFVAAVTAAARG